METTEFRAGKRRTTGVDQIVGVRLRSLRLQAGWSQNELADKLGVSFQQVQKYEKAANRISAAALRQISLLFDVPMEYFFGNMIADAIPTRGSREATIHNRAESRLLARYRRLSPKMRGSILGLLSAVTGIGDSPDVEDDASA